MQKKMSIAVLGLLAAAPVAPVLGAGHDDPQGIGVQFAEDPSGVLGIVNLNGPTGTAVRSSRASAPMAAAAPPVTWPSRH